VTPPRVEAAALPCGCDCCGAVCSARICGDCAAELGGGVSERERAAAEPMEEAYYASAYAAAHSAGRL
jgi:hypothetical protein